jgi:hypothetical protein
VNRRTILGFAAVLTMILAACSVGQVGSPIPSPTELARSTGSPTPSIVPATTPSPSPSPLPSPSPTPVASPTFSPDPDASVDPQHVDPSLEALLPARIGDAKLIRTSAAGSAFPGGGDVCFFLCPDEPRLMAESVGATIEDLTVAVAYEQVDGRVGRYVLTAFRVRGASGADLRAGRISLYRPDPPYPIVGDVRVAGRTVTVAMHWWAPNSTEFMVVDGDALIMIVAASPEDTTGKVAVPDLVATVVKALP